MTGEERHLVPSLHTLVLEDCFLSGVPTVHNSGCRHLWTRTIGGTVLSERQLTGHTRYTFPPSLWCVSTHWEFYHSTHGLLNQKCCPGWPLLEGTAAPLGRWGSWKHCQATHERESLRWLTRLVETVPVASLSTPGRSKGAPWPPWP